MSTPWKILVIALAVPLTAACATSTYDERMAYLKKIAVRGVDTYKLLYSQDARIDKARCKRAFEGGGVGDDMPPDTTSGGMSEVWTAQVEEFFVDSCVSGKPKPVPGETPYPSSSPTPSANLRSTTPS